MDNGLHMQYKEDLSNRQKQEWQGFLHHQKDVYLP
jgi:hypothetical protein